MSNKKSEFERRKEEIEKEYELQNLASNLNRARSVTVGTSFGGVTEVMMRGDGGKHMWAALQPVEVIELITQLAANVGVHIALKPRDDFSSWRDWRVSENDKLALNGWPPFANDMAVFQQLGAKGFNQQLSESVMNKIAGEPEKHLLAQQQIQKESNDANAVATKEIIDGRES